MTAPTINAAFIWKLLKEAAGEFSKDNALRLSAALSYYSVFSLAPLMMIAILIAGKILGPAADQGLIEKQLTSVMGWEAAKAIQAMVSSASSTGSGGTVLSFGILLFGASTVFGQLKGALDSIWEVRPKSGLGIGGYIRDQLLTFSMVLVIGFLLLISLIIAIGVAAFSGWLEASLGLPKFISAIFGFVLPLIIETALFALIFRVLPSADIDWACVWIGAITTAVLFELGKFGLSMYLARGSTTSSFGAAGSVVLVLLWVYYASAILFFGAEITEVYARLTGRSIQPAANAESTEVKCAAGIAAPAPLAVNQITGSPLRPDGPTPREPAQETLTPLIARTILPDPMAARRAAEEARHALSLEGRARLWLKRMSEQPGLEIAAALGVGLVAGIISRTLEKREVSAREHFRLGAEDVAERGQTWLADVVTRFRK